MPTMIGLLQFNCDTNHSAISFRVQYFRGLGGGRTSQAGINQSPEYTRNPFKLEVGVSAPE